MWHGRQQFGRRIRFDPRTQPRFIFHFPLGACFIFLSQGCSAARCCCCTGRPIGLTVDSNVGYESHSCYTPIIYLSVSFVSCCCFCCYCCCWNFSIIIVPCRLLCRQHLKFKTHTHIHLLAKAKRARKSKSHSSNPIKELTGSVHRPHFLFSSAKENKKKREIDATICSFQTVNRQ